MLIFMRRPLYVGFLFLAWNTWAEPMASARRPHMDRRPGAVVYRLKASASAEGENSLAAVRRLRGSEERKEMGAGLTVERFRPIGTNEEFLADELMATGAVEFAEPDYLVPPALVPDDTLYSLSWHHPKINTPSAWDTSTGSGVTIAVLDTGVDSTHPDLAGQLVPGRNVLGNNSDTRDVHGHGTWVAGVAAAAGNNTIGITGVAFNAKIMPIRIADESGYAYWSNMATGIVYAADHGARVANLSYNSSCGASTIISAAQYLRTKKGVLVVAAGNDAKEITDTASADVTCVSATDSSDALTNFSNFGNLIDIAAPGEGIYATNNGGGYSAVNGTSFSAPITAGVYALMIAANPVLTSSQLDSYLFGSVDDLGTAGKDKYFGHGRVDAQSAVDAAADKTPPTVSVTAPADGATVGGTVTLTATASDNTQMGGVQFKMDGANVGSEDTSYPYTYSWNSGSIPFGSRTITAVARDVVNNTATSSPITVTVDNTAPSLSDVTKDNITAVGATISWTSDEPASSQVEYGLTNAYGNLSALNSTLDTSHSVTLAGLSPVTTYYYRVRSRDSVGNLGLSSGTFTTIADLIDPSVTITKPEPSETAYGTLIFSASASDNVGVTRVDFFLSGQKIGEDTTSPYQLFWNTGSAANGTHTLTATAYDAAGNDALSSAVQVIVENTAETLNPPKEAYAYPDPATRGAVPTVRAFFNDIDTLQIRIYDVAGQPVESADVPAVPAGVEDGRLYYDWPWTGTIASGRYFVLIAGVKGGERSYVKTLARVVR
jgi:thermitase